MTRSEPQYLDGDSEARCRFSGALENGAKNIHWNKNRILFKSMDFVRLKILFLRVCFVFFFLCVCFSPQVGLPPDSAWGQPYMPPGFSTFLHQRLPAPTRRLRDYPDRAHDSHDRRVLHGTWISRIRSIYRLYIGRVCPITCDSQ